MKIFESKVICRIACEIGDGKKIITKIFKRKLFGFEYYSINQFLPKIKNPIYDHEFEYNISLKKIAKEVKTEAKLWIFENKHNEDI